MILNRKSTAALIACALMGASASLASTAHAASSSAARSASGVAAHRPAAASSAPTCAYSSANLHFNYWGPSSDHNLVWSSTSSTSNNPVLLENKSSSSSLDCFKALGFGNGVFEFEQNNSSLCLNVAGDSHSSGAWIILYSCVSSSNEKFRIGFVNNQTQIQSVSSGLCLDLSNGFNVLSHVEQKTCQSPSDIYQEWTALSS